MKQDPEIVGLIGRGSSCAMIASGIISRKMPRELVYLHVQKTTSHSGKQSGKVKSGKYIFVDDLICTGKTLKECQKHCKKYKKEWELDMLEIPFGITSHFEGGLDAPRRIGDTDLIYVAELSRFM